MILAGSVIDAARDYHPAFTRENAPDAPVLRFLSRYVRRLTADVLRIHPEAISVAEEITLPLADFDAGYKLPAYQMIHGGDVHLKGGIVDEFDLIDYANRFGRVPRWSGWIEAGVLYLIGDPMWWNDVEKIVLKYAPVPAELTSLKSEIQLPDTAEEALVAACANFMAGRVPADVSPPIDRGYFLALANDAHASFLRQLATSTRVKATYTKEVW